MLTANGMSITYGSYGTGATLRIRSIGWHFEMRTVTNSTADYYRIRLE